MRSVEWLRATAAIGLGQGFSMKLYRSRASQGKDSANRNAMWPIKVSLAFRARAHKPMGRMYRCVRAVD